MEDVSPWQIIIAIYLFVGIIIGWVKVQPKVKADFREEEQPRAHSESVAYKDEWREYYLREERLRRGGYEKKRGSLGQYFWVRTYTEKAHPLFCFVIVPLFWVFLIWGE